MTYIITDNSGHAIDFTYSIEEARAIANGATIFSINKIINFDAIGFIGRINVFRYALRTKNKLRKES